MFFLLLFIYIYTTFEPSLSNSGSGGAIKSFLFSVEPAAKDKVNYIGATVGATGKTYLRYNRGASSASRGSGGRTRTKHISDTIGAQLGGGDKNISLVHCLIILF